MKYLYIILFIGISVNSQTTSPTMTYNNGQLQVGQENYVPVGGYSEVLSRSFFSGREGGKYLRSYRISSDGVKTNYNSPTAYWIYNNGYAADSRLNIADFLSCYDESWFRHESASEYYLTQSNEIDTLKITINYHDNLDSFAMKWYVANDTLRRITTGNSVQTFIPFEGSRICTAADIEFNDAIVRARDSITHILNKEYYNDRLDSFIFSGMYPQVRSTVINDINTLANTLPDNQRIEGEWRVIARTIDERGLGNQITTYPESTTITFTRLNNGEYSASGGHWFLTNITSESASFVMQFNSGGNSYQFDDTGANTNFNHGAGYFVWEDGHTLPNGTRVDTLVWDIVTSSYNAATGDFDFVYLYLTRD